MIVTFVHVFVLEDHIPDFILATIENHKESVKEHGNLRFDILRDASEPAKFVLYEAYESEEAALAHKNTPHYLTWRETVAPWMAKPRQGIKHTIVYPSEPSAW
jgi:(4S)-4-hydroxy-5-phosphonooxypentane-2,3-dione isomerase